MTARRHTCYGVAILAIAATLAKPARAEWLHYASSPARNAVAAAAPVNVSAQLWLAERDAGNNALVCEGASSPVVSAGRVFVNARHFVGASYVNNKLVAFSRESGEVLWERVVDKAVLNSWSSPAVDTANGVVLIVTGSRVTAVDATNGGVAWTTVLDRSVVNASPVVADDLSPGRAFMTDYDPYGGAGQLYCINTSPFDAGSNPYQPGDIVWREFVGGTSGATPAYEAGTVFVAAAAGPDGFPGAGMVSAIDVGAPAGMRMRWQTTIGEGFFGGVAIVDGFVYAAGYNFNGAGDNSTLVKLRADDGAIAWTIACERTASIPVVSGQMIYLSAGVQGFGSVPKVQAFVDHGAYATKLWDSYTDSGGSLVVGGWTHQPVLAGGTLFVGKIPLAGNYHAAGTDLYLLDVARVPSDTDFVRQHVVGLGSSPAVSEGRLYTIGGAGLYALAPRGDYSGDGQLSGPDVQGFLAALLTPNPSAEQIALGDFDDSGLLSPADVPMMVNALLCP